MNAKSLIIVIFYKMKVRLDIYEFNKNIELRAYDKISTLFEFKYKKKFHS